MNSLTNMAYSTFWSSDMNNIQCSYINVTVASSKAPYKIDFNQPLDFWENVFVIQ